ncbi:putative oxidoreductase [Fusarium oxysporum f. sp. cubense]|uniref:Putative oxidoreductase n=1 Tax=Fusarium oxysporum f. sp. cubense TaxID=61366 RepID=A0A559KX36_FUSOC|nr:putative oxidoreductase [Fusarium oxysporum f. sp. cubense]
MAARTVLITGGGNGIGLATVQKLLASDKVTHVLVIDINVSNLAPLAQQYPRKLHIVCGNVTKQSDSLKAVNTLIEKAGSISDLILNAGTFKPVVQLPTITIEAWKATFDVNFFSIVHMVRLAWPHLLETNGSIMVTSSRVSQQPAEYWTCYATTKSALNYFISRIPLETNKIRCVALTPGAVDTDLMRNAMQGEDLPPSMVEFMKKLNGSGNLLHRDQPASGFLKPVETGIPEAMNGKTLYWEDIVNGDAF